MVDAQALNALVGDHREDQLVRACEYLRVFDAQAGEVVDVEEAPVVDLVRGDAPVCEPVVLRGDQRIEAAGIAGKRRATLRQRARERGVGGGTVCEVAPQRRRAVAQRRAFHGFARAAAQALRTRSQVPASARRFPAARCVRRMRAPSRTTAASAESGARSNSASARRSTRRTARLIRRVRRRCRSDRRAPAARSCRGRSTSCATRCRRSG